MLQQKPLPLAFNIEHEFKDFYPGSNAETIDHLRQCARGSGEFLIFIWGEQGLGKTHLLQACCKEAHDAGRTVSYLPFKSLKGASIEILEGLENQQLVCLDDIDAIGPNPEWEVSLFELFNQLKEREHQLIVSAKTPPAKLPIQLQDLKTRLSWGLTLMLKHLNDEDKIAALTLQAEALGLVLSPKVGQFLLSHHKRDLNDLRQLLKELDQASLSVKRKLTVPFIKKYLDKKA